MRETSIGPSAAISCESYDNQIFDNDHAAICAAKATRVVSRTCGRGRERPPSLARRLTHSPDHGGRSRPRSHLRASRTKWADASRSAWSSSAPSHDARIPKPIGRHVRKHVVQWQASLAESFVCAADRLRDEHRGSFGSPLPLHSSARRPVRTSDSLASRGPSLHSDAASIIEARAIVALPEVHGSGMYGLHAYRVSPGQGRPRTHRDARAVMFHA
jgi:hypothetical protein